MYSRWETGQGSPLKGLNQAVRFPLDLKDLYRFVRRTSRQPPAIVIQTSIMLWVKLSSQPSHSMLLIGSLKATIGSIQHHTYNHVFMP